MWSWDQFKSFFNSSILKISNHSLPPPTPLNIRFDTRQRLDGCWFLPLKGARFDGHDFIDEAFNMGAIGVFSERKLKHQNMILVSDTLETFYRISHQWRIMHDLKIAALTGSVGKTTTKYLVGHILGHEGETLPYEGNFNNEFGVPQMLFQIRDNQKFGVIEIGARHVGDIQKLTPIIEPDCVAVLNVGHAHLAEFGGRDGIYRAKLELFESAPKHATLITNYDDPKLLETAQKDGRKCVFFGTSPKSDICIQNVQWLENASQSISYRCFGQDFSLFLEKGHDSLPINIAAAIAICFSLGVPCERIFSSLKNFKRPRGRFDVFRTKDFTVVDDTYNASPESMVSGLMSFLQSFPSGKKILILGDMLELGERSTELHEKIGEFCAKDVHPELILAVGNFNAAIARGATKCGFSEKNVRLYTNVQELIKDEELELKYFGQFIFAKASNGVQLSLFMAHLKTLSN